MALAYYTATTNGSTAATSHSVTLPTATYTYGDTIIVLARATVAGAIGWPDGTWTEMVEDSSDASDDVTAIAWKTAVGNESGTTITVTHGNGKLAAIAILVTGGRLPGLRAPELSTVAVGTGTNPDPTTCTPTGGTKPYLWIWMGGWDGEQTSPPATGPTDFTGGVGANTGTSGITTTNCRVAVWFRNAYSASSYDAGSCTLSASAAAGWSAWLMAVHPNQGGGTGTFPYGAVRKYV